MANLTHDDRHLTFRLEERSDAAGARAMRELLLLAKLDDVELVKIDAAPVVKVELAVIQVLLAWCVILDARQIPWQWQDASDSFRHAVQHVGLVHAFRLVNGQSA